MNCDEVEDLAGAYALRALPSETLREVEEHLATCSAHPDIAALRQVALSLAQAAPERVPPAALKSRLMQTIRAETAAPAEAAIPSSRRRWAWPRLPAWPRLSPYALAAALAVAVAGLLAWNISLQLSEDGGQSVASVRTLTGGGAATGRIVILQYEGKAVLTVSGLPPLIEDETYQVWAIGEEGTESIGLFDTPPSGEASTVLDVDFSRARTIAITVEPAGGSLQPTGDPVLSAQL